MGKSEGKYERKKREEIDYPETSTRREHRLGLGLALGGGLAGGLGCGCGLGSGGGLLRGGLGGGFGWGSAQV